MLADPHVTAVMGLWLETRRYPDAPPFSGGVLTDWPALAVDAFAVCREEEWAIDAFLRAKEASSGPDPANAR